MIKLYYTGAAAPCDVQNNPVKSIGGYISSSVIPNDEIGNILSDITMIGRYQKKRDISCIAVKNDGSETTQNMKLWISSESISHDVSIAVVQPTIDDDGKPYFESLQNRSSKPYYADFFKSDVFTEAEPLDIGVLKPGEAIGLWIMREMTSTALDDYKNEKLKEYYEIANPDDGEVDPEADTSGLKGMPGKEGFVINLKF